MGSSRAKLIFGQPCVPLPQHHINRLESIAISHTGIHVSHIMAVYKGIYYCTVCGAVLGTKLVKLKRACEPPTDAGLSNKRRINDGLRPYSVTLWPIEVMIAPTQFAPVPLPLLLFGSDRLHLTGQVRRDNALASIDFRINAVASRSLQTARSDPARQEQLQAPINPVSIVDKCKSEANESDGKSSSESD